jgi:hypothetical protein
VVIGINGPSEPLLPHGELNLEEGRDVWWVDAGLLLERTDSGKEVSRYHV